MDTYSRGLLVVALLSMVFGLVEVETAFAHNFAGVVSTTQGDASAYWSATVGSSYAIAGIFLLTRRRWGADVAVLFFAADIVGRVGLVVTGLYPLNSLENDAAILFGTLIAALFGVYVALRRGSLS